ncbi:19843_t:CDS:2, partial [Racocetra fulgida]
MDYATLFKKCWSSRPDLRPALNDILSELERLSRKNPVEFITNVIDNDGEVTQLMSNASTYSRNSILSNDNGISFENVPILSENASTLIDLGDLIPSNDNGRQSTPLENISSQKKRGPKGYKKETNPNTFRATNLQSLDEAFLQFLSKNSLATNLNRNSLINEEIPFSRSSAKNPSNDQ